MENRQYQQDMQAEARAAMLAGHRSILMQLATGGGKTRLAADMIYKAIGKGHTVHFGVHRDLLVRQTAATFKEHQIPFSYIASGYSHNPYNRVHIVSLDTIKRRVDRPDYKFPSLLFFDEGHLGGAAGYSKVIDAYKAAGCYIVLLSATPWRLSGEGLGRHCSYMVKGPSMSWLIEQGFLSRYRFFSPSSPDMSGLHTRMGEYIKEEVEARMDSVLIGDAVKHYLKAAPHSLNITYCVSRKRSEETAQAFRDAGVPAMHIDGLTPQGDRDRIIKAYARRELRVLTNVELITTGFDLASQVGMDVNVESISLLRPTQSLSLYLQQCLDKNTEILTKRGWRGMEDISQIDLVAAVEPKTGMVSWEHIDTITKRPIGDESFVSIKSPHLDFKVSEGHDMILSCHGRDFHKETAGQAANRKSMFNVMVSGLSSKKEAIISDDELLFLGWFLSDGTHNKINNSVSISQSANSPYLAEIRSLINRLGFKYGECRIKRTGAISHCADSIMFTISHGKPRGSGKELTGWRHLGRWIDKKVGPIYDTISSRQLGVLLQTWNKGDGSKPKNIDWVKRTYQITCGDNKIMADRLQALCVTRGYKCNMSEYQPKIENRKKQYLLNIREKHTATIAGTADKDGTILNKKPYKRSRLKIESPSDPCEIVWCVTNRVGTIITRRNGKVIIMGNCGRGLRRKSTPAVILDHANCRKLHGFPDDDHNWTLSDREKKAATNSTTPVRHCPQCFFDHRPAPKCPNCGLIYEVKYREVEQVEGELLEVDKEKIKQQNKLNTEAYDNQWKIQTLDDLIKEGYRRGYARGKCEAWAAKVYTAREAKRRKK